MSSYGQFEPERIKHLELVQAVVSRLGSNGFLVKGWAVTVSGAFLGFAITDKDCGLAIASAVPTLAFWGLDTYFLRSERLFRCLYDEVRKDSGLVPPFFMGATSPGFLNELPADTTSWWKTAFRPTLLVFYIALLMAGGIVAIAL